MRAIKAEIVTRYGRSIGICIPVCIDVFICKLRKKLSLACGGDNYIETVWGRGYVLRAADEVTLAAVA